MNEKGSLTVMASLSLMIIASVLCVLLEAARQQGMKTCVIMAQQNAMESVLSGYERTLFDEYNIFLYDMSFGEDVPSLGRTEGELLVNAQKNMNSDFYCARVSNQQITEYLLPTDDDGMVFRKAVIDAEKPYIAEDMYDAINKLLSRSNELVNEGKNAEAAMDFADGSIESAKAERESQRQLARENKTTGPPEPNIENPMDEVRRLKRKGILNLVLPDATGVSKKSVTKSSLLSLRRRIEGNWSEPGREDNKNDLLFNAFINNRLTCYGSNYGEINHALDYEREYIAVGKPSDVENLKTVVKDILLIRQGINYAKIHAKQERVNEAYTIAAALLSFTGFGEAAVFAVAEGIVAAWAYIDSIEDLRVLMKGGYVDKICYEDYLNALVFLNKKADQNFRTMDIIEQNIRVISDNSNLKLDNMAVSFEAEGKYEILPLFYKRLNNYEFICKRRISYLKT